jgi:hypothetical protein
VKDSTPLVWSQFLKMFREKKLSIFKPKKDQCNICALQIEENIETTDHYKENKLSQEEKRKDKENKDKETYVLCADVQSALPCPQLFVNATYYRSKLNCHNYTLCNLKNLNEVDCYFFSEDEAGLEADVFISCLLDHLTSALKKYPNIKRIILYTDSCPAQNKNIKLSNALLHFCIVNQIVLEQKFLVVGHTYMEADANHSMIERQCRKKNISTPKDYVEQIVACRLGGIRNVPYTVHYIKSQFFRSHKNEYYSNIRPGNKTGDPKVTDIRALRYDPSGYVYYKLSFLDNWALLPNKMKKSVLKPSTQLYRAKPGITDAKRKHLLELCPYLPEYAQTFYRNL